MTQAGAVYASVCAAVLTSGHTPSHPGRRAARTLSCRALCATVAAAILTIGLEQILLVKVAKESLDAARRPIRGATAQQGGSCLGGSAWRPSLEELLRNARARKQRLDF